jgi:hypothetical protein
VAKKTFRLKPEQIRPLAAGHGACIASDSITVDGRKVGFMYREAPDNDQDSGWRFLSGQESQEYLDDPGHMEIYDVNTIANYDPDIIPLLDGGAGSAFAREGPGGKLIPIEAPPAE